MPGQTYESSQKKLQGDGITVGNEKDSVLGQTESHIAFKVYL